MSEIAKWRKAAGLTQQGMSDLFEIPKRTIENWESGSRSPAPWAEKLIVAELKRIAAEKQE